MHDDSGIFHNNSTIIRDIFCYYTVGPNADIISDFDTADNLCAATNIHIVANHRTSS